MAKRNPIQERSIRSYESIIRATNQIIEEGGYSATTTNKIAARAGVGIGTLYAYFDSKEDILIELLDYEARLLWGRVEEKIPEWMGLNTIEAFEQFVTLGLNLAIEKSELTKVMFGEVSGLMTKEPIVRLLGQMETLINLLVFSKANSSSQSNKSALGFVLLNSLTGILLGVANGLPSTVNTQSLVNQTSRLLQVMLDNFDVVAGSGEIQGSA